MPTNILDTAAAAWNKRKEENKASKQQSLRDGSSTGTGFSKTSTSMLVDPPTNSASTDVASVTGTSIGNTSIVNAAIVDASTQTCSTLSTHISLEQMIMKTFDDSCHMLISEIGLEAENNSENRFAIWTSLDYQQRFDRVRSVAAFLLAFKTLKTKEERQAHVFAYRSDGNDPEEEALLKDICEATLDDLTRDDLGDLLEELAWLELRFHRGETQWQLDSAVHRYLIQTIHPERSPRGESSTSR
jgi:hypothetical protein